MTLSVVKGEVLWTEKYRPQTIEECILPQSIKSQIVGIRDTGIIPNMLFSGGAGVGKTTVAKALCKEMGADWLFINASDENGIDTIRNKVRNFASTVSLGESGRKVVIFDEADYLNPNSAQPALRAFIEEFSKVCSFVLTCNFPNRIIEPLQSRCTPHIEFKYNKVDEAEKKQLCAALFMRAQKILEAEGVEFNPQVLAQLIFKLFPDNRKVLLRLQDYARQGAIDVGILSTLAEADVSALIDHLKAKNFKGVLQWTEDNKGTDTSLIYRKIYDALLEALEPNSIPPVILTLAEAQKWDSLVADKALHMAGMLTEVLRDASFR